MDSALGHRAYSASPRGAIYGTLEEDSDVIFTNLPSDREKEEVATNEANQGTSIPRHRIDDKQIDRLDTTSLEGKAGTPRLNNDNTSPTKCNTRETNDNLSELETSTLEPGVALDVDPCILGRSTICRLQKITTTGVRSSLPTRPR